MLLEQIFFRKKIHYKFYYIRNLLIVIFYFITKLIKKLS